MGQHGTECSMQPPQSEAQGEQPGIRPRTAEDCGGTLQPDSETEEEEKPVETPTEAKDRPQSSSLEKDQFENTEADLHVQATSSESELSTYKKTLLD